MSDRFQQGIVTQTFKFFNDQGPQLLTIFLPKQSREDHIKETPFESLNYLLGKQPLDKKLYLIWTRVSGIRFHPVSKFLIVLIYLSIASNETVF